MSQQINDIKLQIDSDECHLAQELHELGIERNKVIKLLSNKQSLLILILVVFVWIRTKNTDLFRIKLTKKEN